MGTDRKQPILDTGTMEQVVRDLFPDAKSSGKGQQILVRCPFHADDAPSLSVRCADGVYHCFACGVKGNGFDLYMKMKSCDFKKALTDLEALAGIHHAPVAKTPRSQVVATFIYHDEAGNRRYWKKRFEPGFDGLRKKSFAFYHTADGVEVKGRGGNSLLYNTHLLKKSASELDPIFILEGEKKADVLTAWGLTATSLDSGGQSGKGATWRREFTGYFAGKEVYILPDNDETGEEYAASLIKKLNGVAASIKILRLPDLPPKGDLIDWLKMQNTQGAI